MERVEHYFSIFIFRFKMSQKAGSASESVTSSSSSSVELRRRCMKSPTYGQSLVLSLDQLRKNDELCDFTVSAEGKSIKVN